MTVRDLLPDLDVPPRDARDVPMAATAAAGKVLYRMGMIALPVPGLPDSLEVAGVRAEFVRGPIRAQQTDVRQRHGFPLRFDKYMHRSWVGEGEVVLILSLETSPIPEDLEAAFLNWRAHAEAAAGVLSSILDERVTGERVFEDAVLLSDGEAVGAVDMRARVRHFLPFDVTVSDQSALNELAKVKLRGDVPLARAARLYRRAALEGPTADAYVNLWIATEALSESRQPHRAELEAVLAEGGIDPGGLPLHVGLLIDLRGKIVHEGVEDHERLRTAYYEMEALVRLLLRRAAGAARGWWPTNDPAAYTDPWDDRVAPVHDSETTWHAMSLPPVQTPGPERLPRRVANAREDPRIQLDNSFDEDAGTLIANVTVDGMEWFEPNCEQLSIRLGQPPDAPESAGIVLNRREIWIPNDRLRHLTDAAHPEVLVNLVWDLHGAVASAIAMQSGLESEADGVALIEAIGAAHQYERLAVHGEFDPTMLNILPTPQTTRSRLASSRDGPRKGTRGLPTRSTDCAVGAASWDERSSPRWRSSGSGRHGSRCRAALALVPPQCQLLAPDSALASTIGSYGEPRAGSRGLTSWRTPRRGPHPWFAGL